MRMSVAHVPTLKEAPREAELISHQLLLRAGYIRKVAAGIYSFLPLGWRVVRRIEQIVREEMDRAGAQEIRLPAIQPAELWKESGRWEQYGPELLRLKDRKSGDFCVGPTHEEVITDLVRGEVRSYRQLPLNLYQMQTKFRDEIRPRGGLMRGREFIMKDAYSFDVDEAAALRSYEAMYAAYERVFTRCGLDFRAVEADGGNIGGSRSHEFQVLATTGEDAIVSCPSCGYTANVEQAEVQAPAAASSGRALERVDTPGARTAEQVARFLGAPVSSVVKTMVFRADDRRVAVLVPGDREVNEIALRKVLDAERLDRAGAAELEAAGTVAGFVGPVGLVATELVVDPSVLALPEAIVGGNEADVHLRGFSAERDAAGARVASVVMAREGDACGRCGGTLQAFRGIEVGHVFYLGTKYSRALQAHVLREDGSEHPMEMGCYGIGVTRILAAAIEQHHDHDGIRWPMALAPWQVILCPLQLKDDAVVAAAEQAYTALQAAGVDTLLDDRDLRPGNKFKDADLLGIPIRVTISSRGLGNGALEVRRRADGVQWDIAPDHLVETLIAAVRGDWPDAGTEKA